MATMSANNALPSNPNSTPNDVTGMTPPIGIIGSGTYATALTQKLISVGHEVVMGSRHPSKRESALISWGWDMSGLEVTSIDQCLALCDVIFVAMHPEYHLSTLGHFSDMAKNKILVDISNREESKAKTSNAQRLANTMPHSHVVKAFNTVSSLFLEVSVNSMAIPKVYVASDDKTAKKTVMDLARNMGFHVIDFGGLNSAMELENVVVSLFPLWKVPLLVTLCVLVAWFLYIVYLYVDVNIAFPWSQVYMRISNKVVCMTAITMVALTYMPGQIAAILQVYRGTKHQRFSKFLDGWMKCRKQLGLISYFLVIFHFIASTMMMSPSYYTTWYHRVKVVLPANSTLTSDLTLPVGSSMMVWQGEATNMLGIGAFIVMSLIAITSIPSVGETLNWAEWRCVQSHLGTVFMLLSVAHVVVLTVESWMKMTGVQVVKTITFVSIVLPCLVLASQMLFLLTPLHCFLKKIRKGWERQSASSTSNETSSSKSHPFKFKAKDTEETALGLHQV